MGTRGSPAQSRERFSSRDKATEHVGQNVQERCQVGLQQKFISLNVSLYVQVQLYTPTHATFISVCDHINTCRCDTEEIPVLRHEYGVPHLYLLPGSHNELVQSVGSLSTSHMHFKTNTERNSVLVTTFNRMSRHRTKIHEEEGIWNSHHYFTVLHMCIQN